MKKISFFLSLCLFFSCDDGNLQIETIDFDSVSIQSCDSSIDLETVLFFKIDEDEALILDLQGDLLENITSETNAITSDIPGESQLTYRFFSDNVSNTYFCSDIPPVAPTVIDEIEAEGGTITINSKVSSLGSATKNYVHEVEIINLTLVNSLDERLTDAAGFDYGDITTTTSASTELLFANYSEIAVSRCENAPADGQIRLYKILNDEFIALDIPETSIANMATTTPREINLASDGVFRNYVINTLVTTDLACMDDMLTDSNTAGEFFSVAGTASISTVENAPNTDGAITYTHTIALENVQLTLRRPEEEADVVLDALEPFTFGNFTTVAN
ncbi:MAG: hypothetical protein WBG90_22980 [Saonia sp.]